MLSLIHIYQVAAVVDGKTSYMSRPVTLSTAEEITEKPEFTVPEFARGIAVEKVLETLGDTVKVENGQKEVDVTWDLSKADLNQVGTYDITALSLIHIFQPGRKVFGQRQPPFPG